MKNNHKSRKSLAILMIVIVFGGSSLGIAAFTMLNTHPVEDPAQINNLNITKYVENVMKGVPLDCYTYYPNGDKKLQPELRIYTTLTKGFYNATHLNSNNLTRTAPYQAYLFSHCSFFDTTMKSLPDTFDPKQVSTKTLNVPMDIQRKTYQVQQLTNLNFTYVASTFDTIEELGNKFAMTYSETVDQLVLHKLLNQTRDCINPSWRSNSGLLECTYHRSQFIIDTNASSIIETYIKPLNMTGTGKNV
jgi:hypothetical protein